MEITVKEFANSELITVRGRVDSIEAPRFAKALEDANHRGKYNLVIDMSGLEYMSSAGFRALAATQRNCRRYNRGDIVLAQVPPLIHDALDLVGFAEHFSIFDRLESALDFVESGTADVPASDSQNSSSE